MTKKKEESYKLTFKGFVLMQMDMKEDAADHFLDALELWLRRNNENAVILNDKTGGFDTNKVYLEK